MLTGALLRRFDGSLRARCFPASNAHGTVEVGRGMLKEIIELAKLADQAGLGFLGLAEHHRYDFALSAPEIVLAAIARETRNLRLGTAVTVMLLELRDHAVVDWQGRLTQTLAGMDVAPRPAQAKLPVWVGVGGTPASFARAGRLGLPLFVALPSGPARFRRLVELYRQSAADAGQDPAGLQVGAGGHFYAAPGGPLPALHLRRVDRARRRPPGGKPPAGH